VDDRCTSTTHRLGESNARQSNSHHVAGLAASLVLSIAGTGVAAAAVVVHQPGLSVASTTRAYAGPTVAEQVKSGTTRHRAGGSSDFNYANALESDGMDAGCFFLYLSRWTARQRLSLRGPRPPSRARGSLTASPLSAA
jgi:hypothetical protein